MRGKRRKYATVHRSTGTTNAMNLMLMPIETTWIDTVQSILQFNFYGDIIAADLDQFGQIGQDLVDAGRLYVIVDFSAVNNLPRHLVNSALRANALLNFANHSNARFFVFVQPGAMMRNMIDQVFRNTPYRFIDTIDGALIFLNEQIIPNDT